jgi:hypothetical protein
LRAAGGGRRGGLQRCARHQARPERRRGGSGRLLSERPEYITSDHAEIIERLLAAHVAIGDLDRTLLLQADELDRLCGHAVRTLAQQASLPALHVLSSLDHDRLVAMFYALPVSRRAAVRRDAAWAYAVDHAPAETEDVVAEVEALAEELQVAVADRERLTGAASPEDRKQMQRYERIALRQEVDLPVLLKPDEQVLAGEPG